MSCVGFGQGRDSRLETQDARLAPGAWGLASAFCAWSLRSGICGFVMHNARSTVTVSCCNRRRRRAHTLATRRHGDGFSSFDVQGSSFDIPRSTFDVPCPGFDVPHSTSFVLRSTFLILRSTFLIRRPASNVQRPGSTAHPSPYRAHAAHLLYLSCLRVRARGNAANARAHTRHRAQSKERDWHWVANSGLSQVLGPQRPPAVR